MCDIIRNAMGKYLKRLGIILLAAAFSLFLISGPVFAVPSDNDTNPTPDTSEEEQTEEENQEQTTCYDEVGGIGWLVCPGTSFLAKIIDGAYGILNELINVEPVSMEQDAPIHVVWEYLRNLANIAFVIVFIIIIYSQMTGVGISNYGIKRMLPRLIIAAILLNLSYIICAIAVDLSNIVGGGFRAIFDTIGENALANGSVSDAAASTSVAGIVATILGIGAAGTIALYSSFFFFFFLAELLTHLWFDRWAAYLIVFLLMLVIAGVLAAIGFSQIKKVKKPEKTIESVGELKHLKPGKAKDAVEKRNKGLYT